MSSGILDLIGESDPDKIGYGRHIFEHFRHDTWTNLVTPESLVSMLEVELPMILHDMPGVEEELKRIAGPGLEDFIDSIEEQSPPSIWATQIEFVQGDLPPIDVNLLVVRAYSVEGDHTSGACFSMGRLCLRRS